MTAKSARCLLAWTFAAVLLFRGGNALRQSLMASGWPATDAIVTASDARWVEHHRVIGPSMWSYELDLRYAYSVAGREYLGSRASFSAWGAAERFNPLAYTIAAQYPVGRRVVAHYDPLDPSAAVLEAQARVSAWIALFLGIFFAWLGRRYARRVEAEKKQLRRAAGQ